MTLISGCAGFIGYHTALALLREGEHVFGIDSLSDYYDVRLKQWRISQLLAFPTFQFAICDIGDQQELLRLSKLSGARCCVHLAAQAGVRKSMAAPIDYVQTNVCGTANILEVARAANFEHTILASTSSVYANQVPPFSESMTALQPISPYAATKLCSEVLADTWRRSYGIGITVLRFFTVYGPAGRPDMSIFRFIEHVLRGTELTVHGDGKQVRDFTFVTDIVAGIISAMRGRPQETINLGASSEHSLAYLIASIEKAAGRSAKIKYAASASGDVDATLADISRASTSLCWSPKTDLSHGIEKTVSWHMSHRKVLRDISLSS